MSALLRKHWYKLELLSSLKSGPLRKQLLKVFSGDQEFCQVLREIAKNTVNNKVPLSASQVLKLKKYKRSILSLSKRKLAKTRKRKLVIQSGGWLPTLIPLVAAILSEILR